MVRAIDEAEDSVLLSTYIFDNDRAGELFVEAFRRAAGRGVEVRVLLDDLGARYSRPPVVRNLRGAGARVARFLPKLLPRRLRFANLRNHRKIMVVLLGAVTCARSSVTVVTPYFLPDSALVTTLSVAAMRGVAVDILLPAENNLPVVQWASTAQLWQVLERGCRVWLTPPPFDHTKLAVVDGTWVLLGSSNWDPRSPLEIEWEP
jgi:phosphatidylserine/phosphatidylglycerophosphate/cardiolipin synthase-like enzyme